MPAQKQNNLVESCNGRESSSNVVDSRGKENKEQNHCQDDNEEHVDINEKKKKGNKH